MRLYHYTQEINLKKILQDGLLHAADSGPHIPKVVWLTSEKFVPNICRPKDESASPPRFMDVKFYRFLFDSKDLEIRRWTVFQRTLRGGREEVRALEEKALGLKDNPKKWYIAETPLRISEYEHAETDPDHDFFVEGSGAINFFAP